jgi:hypothetical protein
LQPFRYDLAQGKNFVGSLSSHVLYQHLFKGYLPYRSLLSRVLVSFLSFFCIIALLYVTILPFLGLFYNKQVMHLRKKLPFMDMEPPLGYVPGLGRGFYFTIILIFALYD